MSEGKREKQRRREEDSETKLDAALLTLFEVNI